MSRHALFVAHEAAVSLYRQAADGEPETTALWMGGCAERIGCRSRLGEVRVTGMGDRYPTIRNDGDDEHNIEIERLWVIPRTDYEDFELSPDEEYVLDILWSSGSEWHKRRYYGVRAQTYEIASNGIMEFMATQTFAAQRYEQSGGSSGGGEAALGAAEQSVPFFLDTACTNGRMMLGHYRWSTAMRMTLATVRARASQGGSTRFTLMLDGVLTPHSVTIPAGALNEEVSASVALDVEIDPYTEMRWKVTSAPASVLNCAYVAGLSVRMEPVEAEGVTLESVEQVVAYFRDGPAMSGLYLGGDYEWDGAMRVTAVDVRGSGSTGSSTVLTLEVDGFLTSYTVTLPAGSGEREGTLEPAGLNLDPHANARWKVTSAPALAVNCASGISLTMRMVPQ